MSQTLIVEEVNIYQLPEVSLKYSSRSDTEITIGDLHANTMKLLFMLIKHGVIIGMTAMQYFELVAIYQKNVMHLTTMDVNCFKEILKGVTYVPGSLIRLIGDELSDRGNNDLFTLLVLQQLYRQGVRVEILLSNHGIEFIEAYEKQHNFEPVMLKSDEHAVSMVNLEQLIHRGIVTRAEILDVVTVSYKPCLKLLSYTMDVENHRMMVYTHAIAGLETVAALAKKLSISYCDSSLSKLVQTIDAINMTFQEHVRRHTVHSLYDRSICQQGYQYRRIEHGRFPVEFVMWNRFYEVVKRPERHESGAYSLAFVHGHHQDEHSMPGHIYNLDGDLGKNAHQDALLADDGKGEYRVLYTAVRADVGRWIATAGTLLRATLCAMAGTLTRVVVEYCEEAATTEVLDRSSLLSMTAVSFFGPETDTPLRDIRSLRPF